MLFKKVEKFVFVLRNYYLCPNVKKRTIKNTMNAYLHIANNQRITPPIRTKCRQKTTYNNIPLSS